MKAVNKKSKSKFPLVITDILLRQAFDNSLQPTILSIKETGLILKANTAAAKLLGYSKKVLESQSWISIFDISEKAFKEMLRHRNAGERSSEYVTVIKKNGARISCEITSAIFVGDNDIDKVVTTISDMSQHIQKQNLIDTQKKEVVAKNIITAKAKQKVIDIKNERNIAYNMVLARSKQRSIDLKNKKIVAHNIVLAQSRQKGIDKKNEIIKLKQISTAIHKARVSERSEIGRELHDNVNQLLGASKMYIEMGKKGDANSQRFLRKSSEYIVIAIEEIRKMTRGVISHVIHSLGMCDTIQKMTDDIMEVTDLKIDCVMEEFSEDYATEKFKLNIFRIIQEHLNNIIKHAKATQVKIIFIRDKTSLTLSITDDGIGFKLSETPLGMGIQNIKRRAEEYNGAARFFSEPGKGCVLAITFPFQCNRK